MISQLASLPAAGLALPGTLGVRADTGRPVVHDGLTPGGREVPHRSYPDMAALLADPTRPPAGQGGFLRVGRALFRQGARNEAAAPLVTAGGAPLWPVSVDGQLSLRQFGARLAGPEARGGEAGGGDADGAILARALALLPPGHRLEIGGDLWLDQPLALPPARRDITLAAGRILRRPAAPDPPRARAPDWQALLELRDWQGCRLEGLTFRAGQGTGRAARDGGLRLDGCRDLVIAGCRFDACYYGLAGGGQRSRDITVEACHGQTRGSVEALRRRARGAGLAAAEATARALRAGGGALVMGAGRMDRVTVRGCTGQGWNHLVLSGDSQGWLLEDCALADSGDSAFYLRGAHHRIRRCRATRAGKDGIKILDFTDGRAGHDNAITDCQVTGGMGHTRPDGGKGISCQTENSLIATCEITCAGPRRAGLAARGEVGVQVSGSGTTLRDITVTGPAVDSRPAAGVSADVDPDPDPGRMIGLALRGHRTRPTRGLTAEGIRGQGLSWLWVVAGEGLDAVTLRAGQAQDCRALGRVATERPGGIGRVTVQGGGIEGAAWDALQLLAPGAEIQLTEVRFAALAPGRHCLVHGAGTTGRYQDCPWDGSGAARPVRPQLGGPAVADKREEPPGPGRLSGVFP
ncbi:right-handed parallel beta-helix repeat-containing protein [Pseudooceanicola sp. 200-1SW]|uniref:right-handed parallel beta-helix repeat-containing protein n=1 Tax=Pseudooceanicola sp. 200-1SW TaxID=3425949 RepID=UPI003D7F2592